MKKLILTLLLPLFACNGHSRVGDDVRTKVSDLGVDGAGDFYRGNLRRTDPKSYLDYSIFLNDHFPYQRHGNLSGSDYHDALLNCSASLGYEPAVRIAIGKAEFKHGEKTPMAQCVRAKQGSSSSWKECGAEKLLPTCPKDSELIP